jgi:hypothetical protein
MKYSFCCVLKLMLFWAASLGVAAPPIAATPTHGTILSDGPMPYPGPIPPVRD